MRRVEVKRITRAEAMRIAEIDDLERCRWYVGVENLKGKKLTQAMLEKWAGDKDRKLECVFCSISDLSLDAQYCPRCKEYKGLQPYIEGWSDWD